MPEAQRSAGGAVAEQRSKEQGGGEAYFYVSACLAKRRKAEQHSL